jgi:hypothetical protein
VAPVSGAVPAAVAACRQVRAALDAAAGAQTWPLSNPELRDTLAEYHQLAARLEAVRLGLLRDLDARPDAVSGARAGEVAKTFLVHVCRVNPAQARRDVAAAHAVDPDCGTLPRLGQALAEGVVDRGHVDVGVAALRRLPHGLVAKAGPQVDEVLTEHSRRLCPRDSHVLAGYLLARLVPDVEDRFDPDAYTRRSLAFATDATGMLVGRFQLDPAAGAIVKTALLANAAPDPTITATSPTGQTIPVTDPRTHNQRLADALTDLCRDTLTSQTTPTTRTDTPTPDSSSQAGSTHTAPSTGETTPDGSATPGGGSTDRPTTTSTGAGTADGEDTSTGEASGSGDRTAEGNRTNGGTNGGTSGRVSGGASGGRVRPAVQVLILAPLEQILPTQTTTHETDAKSEAATAEASTDKTIGETGTGDASGSAASPQHTTPHPPTPHDPTTPETSTGGEQSSETATAGATTRTSEVDGTGKAGTTETGGAGTGGVMAGAFAGLRPSECLQTGLLTRGVFTRLACDSTLQAVFTNRAGAVINLGRAVRTATNSQRKALTARDRGCVIPGCTAPITACDAHHITHWHHGGPTNLDNLALLCSHHHTAVHAGIWTIRMIDKLPWAIPPPWIDPTRTPLRHPLTQAVNHLHPPN